VISGALTAALGVFYAQFQFFFDPDTVFGLGSVSIRIALIAIIGGMGTAIGPVLGALFIIPLEEFAGSILGSQAAGLSQFVYGLLLIIVILLEPHGFAAMGQRLVKRAQKRGAP
jgi:branched-chain amino acid transport system permease protein